jgi:tetratricopeptide (TPR) repeat protein
LFIERAQAARSDFTVTNHDAPALAQLCHRLDGIPLALELAAARVRSLSVEEISARLDNRFRLLTGGSRTALPRQQTLRALIDWSYDLLTEKEKVLLHRLSVFSGGWALEAAEQVCAGETVSGEAVEDWEVLDLLTSLVDKSLAFAETHQEATRYRLLETVRQYARDRLLESGEGEAVRERHRDYFLHLAEEADTQLSGPEQARWYGRLETEHENLRAALAWCEQTAGGVRAGLRMVAALWRFWEVRGHIAEGRALAQAALARPGAEQRTPARANALGALAALAADQRDIEAINDATREALAIYQEMGDKAGQGTVLMGMGWAQPDPASARPFFEQSLALRREIDDVPGIAESLSGLGRAAWNLGEAATARRLMEEALSLQRGLGNQREIASALEALAEWALERGDYAAARPLQDEVAAIYGRLGDKRRQADFLQTLANLAVAQGDVERAQAACEAALALCREMDDPHRLSHLSMLAGHLLLEQGDFAGARALYEEGLAARRRFGRSFDTGWALLELGHAAWCQRDWEAARRCATEAAARFREPPAETESLLAVLESLAGVAAGRGQNGRDRESGIRAARLFAAAQALRQSGGLPVMVWWRRSRTRLLEAARDVVEGEAYAPAREEGRAMSLEQAVAYALEPTNDRRGGAGGVADPHTLLTSSGKETR